MEPGASPVPSTLPAPRCSRQGPSARPFPTPGCSRRYPDPLGSARGKSGARSRNRCPWKTIRPSLTWHKAWRPTDPSIRRQRSPWKVAMLHEGRARLQKDSQEHSWQHPGEARPVSGVQDLPLYPSSQALAVIAQCPQKPIEQIVGSGRIEGSQCSRNSLGNTSRCLVTDVF
jgi:hypothetical protein